MIEAQRVAEFIWSTLVADSAIGGVNALLGGTPTTPGRIYHDQVPQAALLPAAVITVVSGTDSTTIAGRRVFDTVVVDVRVVGVGAAFSTVRTIADRVDLVLDGRSGTYGGAVIVKLRRDGVQRFVENESGTSFAHLIGTYRSEAYAMPPLVFAAIQAGQAPP